MAVESRLGLMPQTESGLEMDIGTGKKSHSWRKSARGGGKWMKVANMSGPARSRPCVAASRNCSTMGGINRG